MEADDFNFKCHSWFGIILNEVGEIEGTKKLISYLYVVKEHWMRAAELNPQDATSQHLLGRWCYGIVTISRVAYWAARALYGKLPDTSWEEAYGYFQQAENLEPGFWKKNLLMMAICANALKRPDESRSLLLKVGMHVNWGRILFILITPSLSSSSISLDNIDLNCRLC